MKRSIIKIALSSTLATGLVLSGVGPVHSVMAGGVLAETGTAFTMSPIMEDDYGSEGKLVSDILTTQAPGGEWLGIAVTNMDNVHGDWQYWNAGANQWYNITYYPQVYREADSTVYLLSKNDLIRFVPAKDWNGKAQISYKLWEGSSVAPSFSQEVRAAEITVIPLNDAPRLTEAGSGSNYLAFDGKRIT